MSADTVLPLFEVLGFAAASPLIGGPAVPRDTQTVDEVAVLARRYEELKARVQLEYRAATGGDPRLLLVITALQMHEQGLTGADHVVGCLRSALKLPTPAIPSWEEFGRAGAELFRGSCRDTASDSTAGG